MASTTTLQWIKSATANVAEAPPLFLFFFSFFPRSQSRDAGRAPGRSPGLLALGRRHVRLFCHRTGLASSPTLFKEVGPLKSRVLPVRMQEIGQAPS